ncbi:MAG: excinuclease ABC subunit UvrC [Solirubrobacteraceae bacterium]|nr:excinuclease ABC subunit UvrC [Patulibacter sp.]
MPQPRNQHEETPQERADRLREDRLRLPDAPGVYLFHDKRGKVIYVGKANSLKKRVASHFVNPVRRGGRTLPQEADRIDTIAVSSETEALLLEANFIKQYQPAFNIRLRDDKSYPYLAISLDEEFPRLYFTRERHRKTRRYFGPYSSARKVRETLDTLQKIFFIRSCTGVEPGRRSGSPCLDFHIKRCEAPCVGNVSASQYRAGVTNAIKVLEGHVREVEAGIEQRMREAAAAEEFETAALERNRLVALRSLSERQRIVADNDETLDAVAVAANGEDASVQVFQVRDGLLSDRQSFYLTGDADQTAEQVATAFLVQYYRDTPLVPPLILMQTELDEADVIREALEEIRGGRVEMRVPERGEKRRILDLAERNAHLALGQEKLRAQRKREQLTGALGELQDELDLPGLPLRIECFDISTLMGTNTVASMVVFEGGEPKKSDYRRFKIKGLEEGQTDDFASMNEVLERRVAQYQRQSDRSPHDPTRDGSFAAKPDLLVIDGGKGQLSAGMKALGPLIAEGVQVVSLAKRIEEVFVPGRPYPYVLSHDTPALQLLQRVRDEAHRFAITHHRQRRDKQLTESLLDALPGVGPARKKLLITHFGSPDGVINASRDALEAVPGLPTPVARAIHTALHRGTARTGEPR